MNSASTHYRDVSRIVIYGTRWCPYCHRAKTLLDRLGIRYVEIDVDADPSKRREMMARAHGRRTVPQIFIDGQGIGGCDDLHALAAAGKLDEIMQKHESNEMRETALGATRTPPGVSRLPGRRQNGTSLMNWIRTAFKAIS